MSAEKDIKRGFNQGYDLQRLHPTLADKLTKGFTALEKRNDYQKAFLSGAKEYQKEQVKDRARHFTINNKSIVPTKGRTIDREKGKDSMIKE